MLLGHQRITPRNGIVCAPNMPVTEIDDLQVWEVNDLCERKAQSVVE